MKATPSFIHTFVCAFRRSCTFDVIVLGLTFTCAPSAHATGVVSTCDETHLRAAVSGGGVVTFTCSGTITLAFNPTTGGTPITISSDTTIDGSEENVTISGGNRVQVFSVPTGAKLNLQRLTIAGGGSHIGDGGAIYNAGTLTVTHVTFSGNGVSSTSLLCCNGGAIFNEGTLSVTDSTFSGNQAATAFESGAGGAIDNLGALTVISSTFTNNVAYSGGGVLNWGTMTVINSTFSGNQSGLSGGGIGNQGTLTVTNSTFSGNSGSGIAGFGGGGIFSAATATATLKNTILANNISLAHTTLGNCYGVFTDGGGNLSFGDSSCPFTNADPKLGPLQNNGGHTQTMALGTGSSAIGNGVEANCPVSDQRGFPRPFLKDKLTAVFDLPGASNPPAQPAPWGSLTLTLNANGTIGANLTMSPGLDLGILLFNPPSSATVSGLPANWIAPNGACAGNGFGCFSSFVATDFNGIAGFFGVGLGGIVPSPLSNLSFTISTPSGFSGVDQLISGSPSFVIGIDDPTTNTVTGVAGGTILGCSIGAYEPGTLFQSFHISDNNTYLTANSFGVRGTFTLGTDSDGGILSSNGAQFRFGAFSTVIPPNSFTGTSTLTYVNSAGTFRMSIQPLWGKTYAFSASGSANITGTTRPILLQLTVGDDGGTTHTPVMVSDD